MSLFVVGQDDKVDSNYILSHIAPELSPQGSIKQAKETKILEYFQDFLYELEDTQPAENEETQTNCSSGDAVDDWAGTQTFASAKGFNCWSACTFSADSRH